MTDEHPTEARIVPARVDQAKLSLLVMSPAGVFSFALPDGGEITIGRSADCTVRIDDMKASRVHAIVRVGPPLEIVDRGSMNGTLLGDRKLAPNAAAALGPGSMITIGSTVLVVQSVASHAPPKRVWSEAALDARFEEERLLADREGTSFALVRVRFDTGALADEVQSTSDSKGIGAQVRRSDVLEAILDESLRPTDVVALGGPGVYDVLLTRTDLDVATALAAQLRARLEHASFAAEVGFASYPDHGNTRAALEARADAARETGETPPPSVRVQGGAMARLDPFVDRVAGGTINVLVLGETGVGKEVMARAVHERSPRRERPFVVVNCAALSETLLESELFGHEKGAFTGALAAKPGLLEAADGGTMFLDEIGEMPVALQAKLLRVLEQREVRRVGALKSTPIDVRFVAATNRDLAAEIAAGRFRQDLFFRLNGVSITIPPLRERSGEIEPLARAFVAQASALAKRKAPAIAPPVMEVLRRYAWPGNIRELRNVMERATLLCAGSTITLEHVPAETMAPPMALQATIPDEPAQPAGTKLSARALDAALKKQREEEEDKKRIAEALERCAGNQTQAAKLLGISRRTLVSRLEIYDMPRPRKRGDG